MIVVGIDPSLTATGVAVIDLDDVLAPAVHVVSSKPTGDTITDRLDRISRLVDGILDAAGLDRLNLPVTGGPQARVVIEAPAYSSRIGHQHDRSGLWWVLVDWCRAAKVPVVEVPPAVRAKYATGKGNATKGAVIDATARRFPHVDTRGDDNACDALWLAAIGAHLAGTPVVDLPVTHRDALARVTPPKEWKP